MFPLDITMTANEIEMKEIAAKRGNNGSNENAPPNKVLVIPQNDGV